MRKSIIAVALVSSLACGSDATGPQPRVLIVGDTTFVELPVTAAITVGSISIDFLSVPEDSRCPLDVVCVWSGEARTELGLTHMSLTVIDTLSTLSPSELDIHGYRVSLRALDPYPVLAEPHGPEEYVAHLAVFEVP